MSFGLPPRLHPVTVCPQHLLCSTLSGWSLFLEPSVLTPALGTLTSCSLCLGLFLWSVSGRQGLIIQCHL